MTHEQNYFTYTELSRPLNITLTASFRLEESDAVSSYLYWSGNIAESHDQNNIITNLDMYTFYAVSVYSESNQSYFTTSNTSIQLTLFYDEDYNISVVARNCIGMSEPADLYVTWDG